MPKSSDRPPPLPPNPPEYSIFVNLWWTCCQVPLFWALTLWRQRSVPLTAAELGVAPHAWW